MFLFIFSPEYSPVYLGNVRCLGRITARPHNNINQRNWITSIQDYLVFVILSNPFTLPQKRQWGFLTLEATLFLVRFGVLNTDTKSYLPSKKMRCGGSYLFLIRCVLVSCRIHPKPIPRKSFSRINKDCD